MSVALLTAFSSHPEIASSLSFDDLSLFISLVRLLKPRIALNQPSTLAGPPFALPRSVHTFLCAALPAEDEVVKLCWAALRDFAWEEPSRGLARPTSALINIFLEHGLQYEIGIHDIYPPVRTCVECHHALGHALELAEPLSYAATLFTKDWGPVPVWTTSLYCRQCHTRYYHNYHVHSDASTRTYYAGVPGIIQISQKYFIESDLVEMFANLMTVAWTSATNCAKVYNLGFGNPDVAARLPRSWPVNLSMDCENVWDAFFLHALLNDHNRARSILELPNQAPSHADRLRPALEARNLRMVGPGQPQWNHACEKCTWVKEDDAGVPPGAGVVRSTVTDGVTLGHPCCAVHDCQVPLTTQRHIYCPSHAEKTRECAVVECSNPRTENWRTCALPEHRELEEYQKLQGKAMFQLKRRLQRVKASQVHDSVPTPLDNVPAGDAANNDTTVNLEGGGVDGEEEVYLDRDGMILEDEGKLHEYEASCADKPETGNKKIRARFGRRRTHNEELCVATCGVILGRATFFGSEAPNGVRLFWKGLFPTPASMPQVQFMDNNCKILQMLQNRPDPHFENTIFPVDVFHFKSKHKESDHFCATHCNPMNWPELLTDDGLWRFNSSAAEQTNAWFGGYLSIVREMRVDRYNFFLDEMVRRRNEILVADLQRKGFSPYLIPREVLLTEGTTV